MGIITERRLAALNRVYALCTTDPLPPGLTSAPPGFATQVAALQTIITTASSLMTDQSAGFRITAHSTRERQSLRTALRHEYLLPLSQVARSLEHDHPGISAHFRVPPWNSREAQLLDAASAMASEAAKPEFASLFSAQLGTDFLTRLQAAVQAVTASGDTNEQGRRGHVSATAGVDTALTQGTKIVRYILSMVKAGCSVLAKTDPVSAAQTLRRFDTAARVTQLAKATNQEQKSQGQGTAAPTTGSSGTTKTAASTTSGSNSTPATTPAQPAASPQQEATTPTA